VGEADHEDVDSGEEDADAEGRRVGSRMEVALDVGDALLLASTEGDAEESSSSRSSSDAATQRSAS
jgi:hypothetical protein